VDSLGSLFRPVLMLDGSEEAWVETAFSFDGPMTVEAWVRLAPKIGNVDGILGVPGVVDLNFFDSKFRVFAGPKIADAIVSKKPIIADLWTHLAAVRDADGLWKIYTNGEIDNAESKPAPGRIENIRIGWTGGAGGTEGALAEYRLWDRARSADEIRRDFDRSFGTEKPAGLVFESSSAASWGKLHSGAKIVKTSDLPPVASPEEAAALDAKFAKFRALTSKPGDAARGKQFAAVCMACHLFGTTGGNIGPNLSAVGAMGPESILRNILTPNAAMENGYRIFRVELKSGDLVDALFVSEDKDAVVIRLPGAEDRRIPRSEIRATSYQRRSLMPEGLLDGFTPAQASALFAYLLSRK
jgi:putative heme-binding domain-containing protein